MQEARHKPLHMELVTPLIAVPIKGKTVQTENGTVAAWG